MAPKEKAKYLVDKYTPLVRFKMGQEDYIEKAKECAIITADELLNELIPSDFKDEAAFLRQN